MELWAFRSDLSSRKQKGQCHFRRPARRGLLSAIDPVHLDIVVDAIEPAVERAKSRGRVSESEIVRCLGENSHVFRSFENACIIEFIGRGYDESQTSRAEAEI